MLRVGDVFHVEGFSENLYRICKVRECFFKTRTACVESCCPGVLDLYVKRNNEDIGMLYGVCLIKITYNSKIILVNSEITNIFNSLIENIESI